MRQKTEKKEKKSCIFGAHANNGTLPALAVGFFSPLGLGKEGCLEGKGGKEASGGGILGGAISDSQLYLSSLSVEFGRRKGGQRPTLDAQRASNFYEGAIADGPFPSQPTLDCFDICKQNSPFLHDDGACDAAGLQTARRKGGR